MTLATPFNQMVSVFFARAKIEISYKQKTN